MGSETAFPSCPGSQKGDLRGLGFDEGNLCFCFVFFFLTVLASLNRVKFL